MVSVQCVGLFLLSILSSMSAVFRKGNRVPHPREARDVHSSPWLALKHWNWLRGWSWRVLEIALFFSNFNGKLAKFHWDRKKDQKGRPRRSLAGLQFLPGWAFLASSFLSCQEAEVLGCQACFSYPSHLGSLTRTPSTSSLLQLPILGTKPVQYWRHSLYLPLTWPLQSYSLPTGHNSTWL